MKRALPWILASLLLSRTESTLAYCGATTCGALPDDQCETDAQGCAVDGVPLAWPLDASVAVICTGCDELTAEALSAAVGTWQAAACEGEAPSINFLLVDEPSTDQEQNAVVVEVIEEGWLYDASAVGRTTLEFGLTTGTIVRATIALNAEDFLLGTATDGVETDVQAVLTHELGHALGLAHSSVSGATMQAEAVVGYVAELSTLEEDDEEGLCALYPPEPTDAGAGGEGGPSPSGPGAGCSVAGPGAPMPNGATLGAVWTGAMLLLLGLERRRISSIPRSACLIRRVSSTLRIRRR